MLGRAGSRTASTLSTAIGDSNDEYWDTTLLLRALHGTEAFSPPGSLCTWLLLLLLNGQQILQGTYVLEASSSADLSSKSIGIDMESNTCGQQV